MIAIKGVRKACRSVATTVVLPSIALPAAAQDFTAGVVMSKMKSEERYPYLSGLIEGLAYARFVRDEKKTEGMGCIYDWFYKDPKTLDLIYVAFGRYPNFTPGAVVDAWSNGSAGVDGRYSTEIMERGVRACGSDPARGYRLEGADDAL